MPNARAFDYIIIGGGSAGAVLAGRLSEQPDVSVLLLEAGRDIRDLLVRMPALANLNLHRSDRIWAYTTAPQRHLNKRSLSTPRGKLLGGTSAINGMVYMRGHPADYDRWVEEGAVGWGYNDVLPFFLRAERYFGPTSAYRGKAGPLPVVPRRSLQPLSTAFLEACAQAGIPLADDPNGANQEGAAPSDLTTLKGRRVSSADAYLPPDVRRRPNLVIRTECRALRIRFSNARACGVEVESRGTHETISCNKEVIVSAGAVNTPQLLMLSGVGPAPALERLGLAVIADAPHVGAHLQDHLAIDVGFASTVLPSLSTRLANPIHAVTAALAWTAGAESTLGTNGFEVGAMLKSSAHVSFPDLQCMFIPVAKDVLRPRWRTNGFTLSIGPGTIESRGAIRLISADPRQPPEIDPNYLDAREDLDRAVAAVEIAFSLADQPALRSTRGRLLTPAARPMSRQALEQVVRASAFGAYHLAGSCRMGTPEHGAVDAQGRVYGVEGLRVCDASIMPSIPNANLNAPVIMMAEKIAEAIRTF